MVINGVINREDLEINIGELALRLSVPKDYFDTFEEKDRIIDEVQSTLNVRYSFGESEVFTEEEGTVRTDFGTFTSKNLVKMLKNSDKIAVMGVTLGSETDRFLRRLSFESSFDRFFADGVASAFAEAAADKVSEIMGEYFAPSKLTGRFSPGYGDFDISGQKEVLAKIEGAKNLGISLTDSFLMIPQKSITAFHGVIVT